eukprot:gb/GECG01000401.1/.p1 GENE.gb/GECG01000401.1/~~gb/GECG01000401.1/.p1  ORF type:complete len:154 (+),score=40.87 gb/GECG01000401.1/:1-462(+)
MSGPILRVVAQVLVAGANTFVKAFQAAYQNASRGGGSQMKNAASVLSRTEMSVTEARKVLNFSSEEGLSRETILEQFKNYFEANDPNKGGSFYLQCKIYHAKNSLLKELGEEPSDEDMAGVGDEENQEEEEEEEQQAEKAKVKEEEDDSKNNR